MDNIQYIGEHLLPGQIGHFLVLLMFVSGLLSALGYYLGFKSRLPANERDWNRIGRISFVIHGLSVFGVIATIFYIMVNQYYEYSYAWEHVSDDLPYKYILSAFWEGQEGSFLLWMFWHVILGFVIINRKGKWEAPVLTVLALIQVFIASMILGLYFGAEDVRIGSSPFTLLRDVNAAPIFARPDYLKLIQGNGLNPLLQNYWMTIHPPVLFLGFASTSIPFCFAIAALWRREHKEWLKPAMPWALFSASILGTGILMGGAWAYEALSFGGYWAWDPVENMSLVPWLILVAGVHTALIAKTTGHGIKITYTFFSLTFLMILYSTFLTRSGILGDTSVHAFTEMGLEWQLILFMAFFGGLFLITYLKAKKTIPIPEKEESTYSKEFWMFIGALILLFSAVIITFTTSIPVYNKLFEVYSNLTGVEIDKLSPPLDPVAHHNKYQLLIGVFIALFSGITQFLRYKETSWNNKRINSYLVRIGVATLASIALSIGICALADIWAWQYILLMGSGIFTIWLNTDYLINVLRGRVAISGSAVGHIGFGILLIGIIFSGLKKQFISADTFERVGFIEGLDTEADQRNKVLLYKDVTIPMRDYMVTYQGDSIDGFNRYFKVNYKRLNEQKQVVEEFNLFPNILYNKTLTKIETANPSTKHYISWDVFTHIAALPTSEMEPETAKIIEDSLKYQQYILTKDDTVFTQKHYVVFEGFDKEVKNPAYKAQEGDIAVTARIAVRTIKTDSVWYVKPVYLIRGDRPFNIADAIPERNMKVRFTGIDPTKENIRLEIAENMPRKDYIVLEAIVFPGINLVWLGSIMMMLGLGMGMYRRRKSQ